MATTFNNVANDIHNADTRTVRSFDRKNGSGRRELVFVRVLLYGYLPVYRPIAIASYNRDEPLYARDDRGTLSRIDPATPIRRDGTVNLPIQFADGTRLDR